MRRRFLVGVTFIAAVALAGDIPYRVQPAYWKHVVGQVDNLVRKVAE